MNQALLEWGLTPFFTRQLTPEEIGNESIARVTEVHRRFVIINDGNTESKITLGSTWFQLPSELRPTVGDWVVLDQPREKIERLLDRKSVFKRVAAGAKTELQLIAANVDTLFIVTSCNEEFNESRLERYLALALEAGVDPVLVLTKTDLAEAVENYRARARAIKSDLPVELVNARDPDTLDAIRAWIDSSSTVALVGSSGVGKSTIVNSLAGTEITKTGDIRVSDTKGRHTTTHRQLHRLQTGGLLLDVPGMRELKVAHLQSSLNEVFEEVEAFARQCKFSNCSHQTEPDCAIRKAISTGELSERRLKNYQTLVLEDARNNSSLAEQRQKDRQFTKTVKASVGLKKKR